MQRYKFNWSYLSYKHVAQVGKQQYDYENVIVLY